MGNKSAKKVDFQRLAEALGDYPFAYLVTVDDDYRVHTVTVEPKLRGRVIEVGIVGDRTRANIENHSAITMVWPPTEPGGYSLIVDGRAEVAEGGALQVTATRALLHRNATRPTADALHDCVVFSES